MIDPESRAEPTHAEECEMPEHPRVHIDPTIHRQMQEICLDFPEAIEVEAFGAPSFEIRAGSPSGNNKKFVFMHAHEGRVDAWCKGAPGAQQAYVASEPERYYVPPYLGGRGWIGIRLDPAIGPDWPEVEAIVDGSYRLVAPKRMVARLEARAAAPD